MRKFWISDGFSEKPLNGENLIWLVYPTGLGTVREASLESMKNAFFVETHHEFPMTPINAEFRFLRPAYQNYTAFVDWLFAADRLFLTYQPEATPFLREVSVASLQKTELEGGDWLVCPVVFNCYTPWYRREKLNIRLDPIPTDVSRFSTSRFGSGKFAQAFNQSFSAEIPQAGQLPATLELTFTGAVENPVITVVGMQTGKEYCRCEIQATLTSGDRLEYSSTPNDSYIRLISDGVVTDLSDSIKPSHDPFELIPNTEPTVLRFDGDDDPVGTAEAAIRYFWRTV